MIIKDGYDTLKAQLLKREKRNFDIGFYCERNMKHDIQVIFNGIQIKDSPFCLMPDMLETKSYETMPGALVTSDGVSGGGGSSSCAANTTSDYMVIEGGPLDGLQCGEKMWIIFDAHSTPYIDSQFLVFGTLIAPFFIR